MLRGSSALLLFFALASGFAAEAPPIAPVVTAEESTVDINTGVAVLTGHPRITYGPTLLTADELRYDQTKGVVTGQGHFTITSGALRLLAESGTYDLATGGFALTRVRAGEPPAYVTAASAAGTRERMTLTNARVTYGEPGGFAPALFAQELVYEPGRRIATRHGSLGLGDHRIFALPRLDRSFGAPLVAEFGGRVGYRSNLGAYVDLGLHLPLWPGIDLGANLAEYTSRGPLAGPAGHYHFKSDDQEVTGSLDSGFIHDHGDRKTDLLDRPVPADRGWVAWTHQQAIGDRIAVSGEFNWWRDSDVLRDFRPGQFYPVQQPDSFIEGTYAGDSYFVDLFARVDPNDFAVVQQRLPELRFDLAPLALGQGFFARGSSSLAVLREVPPLPGPTLRSDRFDSVYSIERPIAATPWLTITPVAGGRLTYYDRATGGRDTYTRWLGELGVDAELRASGVFAYRNDRWKIDGLRHLLTPRISYRYVPEADKGQPFIPLIDREVFSTQLPPIDLNTIRNIDELHGLHVLRLGLDNVLQTRDAGYGSRDLLRFNLATDVRLSPDPGERHWSDLYTEMALTPASWVRFEFFQRFSSRTFALRELNTGLTLMDREWWAVRLSSAYLQRQIEQYNLEYEQRVTEVWRGFVQFRYDARERRWNELAFGLRQNLRNTWNIRYGVAWYQGNQREGSFGLNVQVGLIRF